MNKIAQLLALAMLVLSMPAHAAMESGRMKAAVNLLDAMDMRVTLARTVEQVTSAEVDKNPDLIPFKGVMLEFMGKYMGYDSLKDDLAKLYAETFTRAELEELARFYQTPLGRKMLLKLPELTVQGSRLGQQKVEEHLPELEAMITREAERLKAQQAR